MDTEKRQLWDRLENEPITAYRAFESYLALPSGERTLLEAYRHHVGNTDALKPSDMWSGWSNCFAWRERAAAYDDHLGCIRRKAHERGIEEEAERQGVIAERNRNRMNVLMTLGYERAAEWLENAQPSNLRAQDVLNITRLHLDGVKAFEAEQPRAEDDWIEEDEAEIDQVIKEVEALTDLERPEEADGGGEDSEESEGEET